VPAYFVIVGQGEKRKEHFYFEILGGLREPKEGISKSGKGHVGAPSLYSRR
jgi:hypothetical protein